MLGVMPSVSVAEVARVIGVEPPVALILQGASLKDLAADLMNQLGLLSADGAQEAADTVRDRAQQRAAARHGAAMRRKRG